MDRPDWQRMANIVFIETSQAIEIGERESTYWPKFYACMTQMHDELEKLRSGHPAHPHEDLLENNLTDEKKPL